MLLAGQKTTLKAHMNANTNHAINASTQQDYGTINTLLGQPFNGDKLQAVADWYNLPALAGDSQAFANLMLWNPKTTEILLTAAMIWTQPPHGLSGSPSVTEQQIAIGNQWWMWDALIGRKGYIDMTDPQNRQSVLNVWGPGSQTVVNIGVVSGALCGKLLGRRLELALSPVPVGAVSGSWTGAHVCPPNVLGQSLSEADVEDLLLNG